MSELALFAVPVPVVGAGVALAPGSSEGSGVGVAATLVLRALYRSTVTSITLTYYSDT